MQSQPHASTLIILQPRTAEGAPLAFGIANSDQAEELNLAIDSLFRDHVTASTIDVFKDEALVRTFVRTDFC